MNPDDKILIEMAKRRGVINQDAINLLPNCIHPNTRMINECPCHCQQCLSCTAIAICDDCLQKENNKKENIE